MKKTDYIIPIGSPLGIYEGQGRIQNGRSIRMLSQRDYTAWFLGWFSSDVEQWLSRCMEKNAASDEEEGLEKMKEYVSMGLFAMLEHGDPWKFLQETKDCICMKQGIYYREDFEKLTFCLGDDLVGLPNVPLVKKIWMRADGASSLFDQITQIKEQDPEIAQEDKTIGDLLYLLLKGRLILLERPAPQDTGPGW